MGLVSLVLCLWSSRLRQTTKYASRFTCHDGRTRRDAASTRLAARRASQETRRDHFNLFMQNKAKLLNTQMNVNNVLTTNYIKWTPGERGKKQSQNKAKQSQIQKSQNERKFILHKLLCEKKDALRQMKTKPKQTQFKPKANPIQPLFFTQKRTSTSSIVMKGFF